MAFRISKDILSEAIANKLSREKEEVEVLEFETGDGSKKGDGYACEVTSVHCSAIIKGMDQKQEFKFIAKLVPENPARAEVIVNIGMFDIECLMYSKILPELKKYQRRISVPESFYQSIENGVIIMEDLKESNYSLVDKTEGLTMNQIKMVLEQLALLHTSSYHFIRTYGEEKFKQDFELLSRNTLLLGGKPEENNAFDPMFEANEEIFDAVLEKVLGETDPELLDRSRHFMRNRKKIVEDSLAKEGKFMAIYHSDAWYNNFMFRKEDDSSTDGIKMLDLQLCRISRPAHDLGYFFGSSTKPTFRKEHMNPLLQYYYAIFVKELKAYGYSQDIYSFEDLMEDVKECWPYGYCFAKLHTINLFTPPDSEAAFDVTKMDEGGLEKLMVNYKAKQIKYATENGDICKTFVQLAEEAAEMGTI